MLWTIREEIYVKIWPQIIVIRKTNRTHEFVDFIAKISADKGVSFDFTNNQKLKESGFSLKDRTINGYVMDGSITLNIHSGQALNKIVREHVCNNMAGETLVVYNNGKAENIYLAKKNERVTKDGGNNSRKVLDKLARSKNGDNIRNLSVVHIDELAEVSKYRSENLENVHQWLDENGWEFRIAYAQDKKGRIYEMTLNIAKSREGRNILYDINNIKEIDHGDVASKGLAHKNQSPKDSIPQNQQNASENKKFSLSEFKEKQLEIVLNNNPEENEQSDNSQKAEVAPVQRSEEADETSVRDEVTPRDRQKWLEKWKCCIYRVCRVEKLISS